MTGLAVGDEVVALAAGSFATYVTTAARVTCRKPARLSLLAAVTTPNVFLTAAYALEHVAGITRRERVLIHAAAGGVGLAAVQIARRAGAEIFATAGSDQKRDYLRRLACTRVLLPLLRSRTRSRRDPRRGIDVVLNPLAG